MGKDGTSFSYKAFPYVLMVKQISHCGKWLPQALTLKQMLASGLVLSNKLLFVKEVNHN